MKNKNELKNEKEGKIAGMTPVEFTRFIRRRTAKKIDMEIKRLKKSKKFY